MVALASTIASVCLARISTRKDIEIEHLRASNVTDQERLRRSGELIKSAAVSVSDMQRTAVYYGNMLYAKVDTENEGEIFPINARTQLSNSYQSLIDKLHIGVEVEAQILLVGDDALAGEFSEYWGLLSEFSMRFAPNELDIDISSVQQSLARLARHHRLLFSCLSKHYLAHNKDE